MILTKPSPQSAEQIHAWVARQLPADAPKPSISRPINWVKIVTVSTAVLGAITFVAVASPYVIPILQNRNLWAAFSLIAVLLFTSGHMFNHIRKVPYVSGDGKGGLSYFAGGFSNQFGLESQIVAAICKIHEEAKSRHMANPKQMVSSPSLPSLSHSRCLASPTPAPSSLPSSSGAASSSACTASSSASSDRRTADTSSGCLHSRRGISLVRKCGERKDRGLWLYPSQADRASLEEGASIVDSATSITCILHKPALRPDRKIRIPMKSHRATITCAFCFGPRYTRD
jgi:hypothetical protein